MDATNGPALLIDDGGLAALAAAAMLSERGRVAALIAPGPDASGRRAEAIRRKHTLLGVGPVVEASGAPAEERFMAACGESLTLLRGAFAAFGERIGRVVWPVHCGPDADAMEGALTRARLIERLAALDLAGDPAGVSPPVRIETPLLDLTDVQVAEMVCDLDAPLEGAWWCRRGGAAPCEQCGGCLRWSSALSRAKSRSCEAARSEATAREAG